MRKRDSIAFVNQCTVVHSLFFVVLNAAFKLLFLLGQLKKKSRLFVIFLLLLGIALDKN